MGSVIAASETHGFDVIRSRTDDEFSGLLRYSYPVLRAEDAPRLHPLFPELPPLVGPSGVVVYDRTDPATASKPLIWTELSDDPGHEAARRVRRTAMSFVSDYAPKLEASLLGLESATHRASLAYLSAVPDDADPLSAKEIAERLATSFLYPPDRPELKPVQFAELERSRAQAAQRALRAGYGIDHATSAEEFVERTLAELKEEVGGLREAHDRLARALGAWVLYTLRSSGQPLPSETAVKLSVCEELLDLHRMALVAQKGDLLHLQTRLRAQDPSSTGGTLRDAAIIWVEATSEPGTYTSIPRWAGSQRAAAESRVIFDSALAHHSALAEPRARRVDKLIGLLWVTEWGWPGTYEQATLESSATGGGAPPERGKAGRPRNRDRDRALLEFMFEELLVIDTDDTPRVRHFDKSSAKDFYIDALKGVRYENGAIVWSDHHNAGRGIRSLIDFLGVKRPNKMDKVKLAEVALEIYRLYGADGIDPSLYGS